MLLGYGAVGQFAVGSSANSGAAVTPVAPTPPPSYLGIELWAQRATADYARGWSGLLPTGPAWPRDPGSVLQNVILGLSGIWGDKVEQNAALLLKTESDPRSTNLLLPDFERAWGLPDDCLPTQSSDIASRQSRLVTKMTFLGGQSREFFLSQAYFNYGQQVRIAEYSPYQCGISGVGDTRDIDPDGLGSYRWGLGNETIRFYWTATVVALNPEWNGVDLYCLFNRWKPAQTVAVFDYSALQELRGTRPWNSGYYALL